MRFTAVCLALLAIAAIGIAVADDLHVPDGTIYGHVYDSQTKQPVSGAWVYCQETKCPKQLTDSNGYYSLENCFSPSSTHVIECTRTGYPTVENKAKTDSSGKAKVDFNLGNMPNSSPKPEANTTQISSWEKTFGGSGDDKGESVQQTEDSGYIIVGEADIIIRGYLSDKSSVANIWLIKTDTQGNMQWNRKFGEENSNNFGRSVQQTIDGGYIIAGSTNANGAGKDNVWLIKTDANGNKLWDKTFGRSGNDDAWSIKQTLDNGYIVVGRTTNPHDVSSSIWLIKTDANGNKLWDKTFGESNWEGGYSIQQTRDGGYIIAGETGSYGAGKGDVWLIKTDSNGNKLWDRTFGGANIDFGESVRQTSDDGYIIAGFTENPGTESSGVIEGYVWLIKTDSNGNKLWDRTFGKSRLILQASVQQTTDEGYIIVGYMTNGSGFFIKTDANGNKVWEKSLERTAACSVQQTSDGGYIFVGGKNGEMWLKKTDSEGN